MFQYFSSLSSQLLDITEGERMDKNVAKFANSHCFHGLVFIIYYFHISYCKQNLMSVILSTWNAVRNPWSRCYYGNFVLLFSQGDCIIRYYEVKLGTVENPTYECFWLNNYTGKESQRGFGFMPKRGCDIAKNEVARIFRCTKTSVQPVSYTVPRKVRKFKHCVFSSLLHSFCELRHSNR